MTFPQDDLSRIRRMRAVARVLAALLSALCALPVTRAQEASLPLSPAALSARYRDWTALASGLELRAFQASPPSPVGDGLVVALRIDPARYDLALALSAAKDSQRHTARDWVRKEGWVAAINAGMFLGTPSALPVGFTRADGVVLNPRLTTDRSALVFGAPLNTDDPRAPASVPRILDKDCDRFDASTLNAHPNVLQSIRLISCNGRNVWSEQPKRWSIAAIATDADGRVLFIHVRSPYSVHTFAEMLKTLPLKVRRALYLEGGPEATLAVQAGGVLVERFGSYETGFYESDDNASAWPLPNVIGVRRRQ